MYVIDVLIDISYELEEIAASWDLNINKKYKLDEDKIRVFEDILDSVEENIVARGFKVISTYRSHKGYSGYITFYPVTYEGGVLDSVQIRFRISDHKLKVKSGANKKSKLVRIVTFLVNDHVFDHSIDFILEIDALCEDLQNGDLTSLDRFVQQVI